VIGNCQQALGIQFTDLTDDLKEARSAWYTIGLEGRGYCQAYGLICTAGVGDDEVCRQRIEASLTALDRGIK